MKATHNNSIRMAVGAAAAAITALAFAPAANAEPLVPPVASLTVSPNPAGVSEPVVFDGAGSTGDGAGSTISVYEWDLDGDGDFELNTGANPATSRSYAEPGTVAIRLRVTDSEGDIGEASIGLRINAGPSAGFIFEPSTPRVNERVTFSSTSTDPDGQIALSGYQWDFDGDGVFDEAVGETVTVSFPKAGVKTVGLQVTDSDGAVSTKTRKVSVDRSRPKLLSPFPIVRLAGEVRSGGGTKIERLSVRAPRGSKVTVRCRGNGCPFKKKQRIVKRRRIQFPEIEGRVPPGIVLEVYVTQADRIGKFTRFRTRKGNAPKRRDRCLAAGSRKPIFCPSN